MKRVINLIIIGFEMLADGKAALLTKISKENPSANGVHVITEGQLRRICLRTLGVFNPIALKHFIELSNGGARLAIDAEDCKTGESFEKANGEKGTYTKDWTKYSNHSVKLSSVATMKLGELSIAASFNQAAQEYTAPRVVKQVAEVEKEADPEI